MMDDVVVVIRTQSGEDIIGAYISDQDNKVKLQNPFYLRYSPTANDIMMVPYCLFTDETYFEFLKDKLEFVVTTKESITNKYLQYINNDDSQIELDFSKNYVLGNDTKH